MSFVDIHKAVVKSIQEDKEKMKLNPRHNIDMLADENGQIRVYFHSINDYNCYKFGGNCIGSTERFFDTDLDEMVPKDRIEKITSGDTLVHIPSTKER